MTEEFEPEVHEYPIYRGGDRERIAELRRAVAVAERNAENAEADTSTRYGDDSAPRAALEAATDAYNAFVDEVAERTPMLKYRHVGSRRFRKVLLEHPPRKVDSEPDAEGKTKKVDHPDDAGYGLNTETFPWALLAYRDPERPEVRTIVEPEFATERDCLDFLEDVLSDGQFDELWTQVYMVNRGGAVHPKLLKLSETTHTSNET